MAASFRMTRHPTGSIGCTVGLAPHLFVGAYARTAPDALSQAGAAAAQIIQLAKENPEVAAALKLIPGGEAAMTAIAVAAKLFNTPGVTKQEVANTVGTKVAKVVDDILKFF
jgi:hypothetical protein